jgi:hypothetical protein
MLFLLPELLRMPQNVEKMLIVPKRMERGGSPPV